MERTFTNTQACITVNVKHKGLSLHATITRTCEIFIGYPLAVSDGLLNSSDAALYVDKY